MQLDNRLRILLVEDNEGDAALVDEYVAEAGKGQFVLRRARTLAQGHQVIGEFCPQVVLLDLNLPDSKGFATLESFCNAPCPDGETRPPIIVLTSLDDQDMADRAIQGCAQDYLVKNDVNAKVLLRSIRFAIQRHGKDEVDKMLREPDKSDGNQKEAMQVLQRVNRTAPGEVSAGGEPRPSVEDTRTSSSLLLEHFTTGSKATEVIVTGLDQRVRRLEEARHADEVVAARRETLLQQLEKLIIGNGKGPLAARLETLERTLLASADEMRERRNTRNQWVIAVIILVVGWVASAIAYFATRG